MPHHYYPFCFGLYYATAGGGYYVPASHSAEVEVYGQLILSPSPGEGLSTQAGLIEKSSSRVRHLIYRPQTRQGSLEVVGQPPAVDHW